MKIDIYRLMVFVLLPVLLLAGPAAPAQADSGVSLQTPQNGGIIDTLTPTFTWSSSGNAESYVLQIARDVNFQNIVVNQNNLTGFQYQVQTGVLNRSSYFWRVGTTIKGRTSGWSDIWTFGISRDASGTIAVDATLNGQSWSGSIDCSLAGVGTTSPCSMVPEQYSTKPAGTYTIVYNGGGPAGASLSNITPSSTQQLAEGGGIAFRLNFTTVQGLGSIQVYATLDGSPLSTSISASLTGPYMDSISFVPASRYNVPSGTYNLTYNYGGPSYASLSGISPSWSQYLSQGGSISFTVQLSSSANARYSNAGSYDQGYYGYPTYPNYPGQPPPVVVVPPGGNLPDRPGGGPVVSQPIVIPPGSPPRPVPPPPQIGPVQPAQRPAAAPQAPPPQVRPPAPSVQPVQPRPGGGSGGYGGGGGRPSGGGGGGRGR